jgi:Na+/H+ antiporter NhaD/arsenite permease-like protein
LLIDPSVFVALAFLFGIAAQFRAMDGYTFLRQLISLFEGRLGVLYAVVLVTAVFSPFILNDVVVLVLTPVLVSYSKEFHVDIAPLLVAEITFTNIASSLTPLGNPQNILLWQASGISARQFVAGTWFPLAISGLIAAVSLLTIRSKVGHIQHENLLPKRFPFPVVYLCAVGAIIFSFDIIGISNEITLGIAFLFGFIFTSRSLKRLVGEFDSKSFVILCFLIGSVAIFSATIRSTLAPYVLPVAIGTQPYSAIFVALVSNIISNVPATQLILTTVVLPPHIVPKIAVEAGLAGNIGPIGSFANLIALLIVRRNGLSIRKAIILQLVIGTISFLPALI